MTMMIKELLPDGMTGTALARECGVSYQAVQQWLHSNKVPPKRVMQVSRITGIKPEVLNPDVFGHAGR